MSSIIVRQGYILKPDTTVMFDAEHDNDIILSDGTTFGLFDSIQRAIERKSDVKSYSDTKKRIGHYISIIDNCNIRIYYTDTECSLEEAENMLASVFDGKYYTDKDLVGYSECTITGYRMNSCRIGGHNLKEEIEQHEGKYIIFVMEW